MSLLDDLLLLLLIYGVLVFQIIIVLTPIGFFLLCYLLVRLLCQIWRKRQRRQEEELDPITKMLIDVVLHDDDESQ